MTSDSAPERSDPARPSRDSWANAPERFPEGRFAVIEPFGLAVHDWSRPKPGKPRMFDQNFLERLSHIHPAMLVAIFAPGAAYLVWRGLSAGVTVPLSVLLFVTGMCAWTLVEYLTARFALHFTPRSRTGMFVAYMVHGVHHAFPDDDRRWLVPPGISVAITVGFYFGATWLAGAPAAPLTAGGATGYLLYDLSHYAMHRGPSRFAFFNRLRRHHMQHHYTMPDRWYGVSTSIWDHVFGTAGPASRDRSGLPQ